MSSASFDLVDTARYRFALERGATYTKVFRFRDTCTSTPIDYSGYAAALKVVNTANQTVVEMTTENGRITVSGNTVTVTVSAANTAALEVGMHAYTLDLINGGVVQRVLSGAFEIV